MKSPIRYALLCAVSLSLSTSVLAADNDLDDLRSSPTTNEWQLIKNDRWHKIKLYTKRDLGKTIRSFRVEYEVEGDLDTLARVSFDLSNYPRWFFQMNEAKLLKRVSDREFYYYAIHDAPAPVPDRDVVLRVTIQPYSSKLGYAMHEVVSMPDYLPPKPPFVRMVAENYTVKWTPIGKNRWRNVSEGYVDPGGVTPDWAINYVQRMAPYQTVLGVLRMLRLEEFNNTQEPPAFSYGVYKD